MKKLLISCNITGEIKENLLKYGYEPLLLPEYRRLNKAVSAHADMLIFRFENNIITYGGYYNENKALFDTIAENYSIIKEEKEPQEEYPADISLNALALGKKLFCLQKHTSGLVKENFSEIINVKQGYTRCSTCVLKDNCIITADMTIKKAAESSGVEVLLIKEGGIILEGMSCGFIGGASFCDFEEKKLFFFGEIKKHTDYEKIKKIAGAYGIEIICLSQDRLTDYGGAVIL